MAKTQVKNTKEDDLITKLGYFIMYIIVGAVPHIYKYSVYTPTDSESVFYKEPVYADLYMLAKSRVFLFLVTVLIGIFLYQLGSKKIEFVKDKITIGTGFFAIIIILSSLMSEYQDIVYLGTKDRFEGMWVWLGYLVILTVVRHYSNSEKFVKNLLKVFVISAGIMAAIGLVQVFGYDVYTDGPLKWLVFPKEVASNLNQLMTTNVTNIYAVGALFNANYFGVYCGMAAVGSVILVLNEKTKMKVLYALLLVLSYGAMIASRSEAALLGFTVALFVLLLSSAEKIWKEKLLFLISIVALFAINYKVDQLLLGGQSDNARYMYYLMVILIPLGVALRMVILKYDSAAKLVRKHSLTIAFSVIIISFIGFNSAFSMVPTTENRSVIDEVYLEGNNLFIKMTGDEKLQMQFLPTGITAYGEDGRMIEAEPVGEKQIVLSTNKTKYAVDFKVYSNGFLSTIKTPVEINVFSDGQKIQYVHKTSGFGEIQYPERFDFYYNKGNAFSKRGYIWGTYFPLMRENIILGHGLDSYMYVFPQNDVIGKSDFFKGSSRDIIIDKPHSLYMMIGLSMGSTGLFLFLMLVVIVLNNYFSLLGSNKDITSCFAAILILSFIAGTFNDSTIPITMLMFIFGGVVLMPFKDREEVQ